MASFGHVAVGLAAGRAFLPRGASTRALATAMVVFSVLSLLPDADVVAFVLRIPYANQFGHRGASHSLAVAVAMSLLAWPVAKVLAQPARRVALFVLLVVASHGLLDTLTDGGLGCALLWPLTAARYFAPWRPLPVAPIGAHLLSARGLHVIAVEFAFFLPCLLYAVVPRRGTQGR